MLTAKLVRCGDSSGLDLRAPHFAHICASSLQWGISSRLHDCGQSIGEFKVRRQGGFQMLLTLEINVALWGMIVCAALEAAQFFEVF